jgi:hypothetical protein
MSICVSLLLPLRSERNARNKATIQREWRRKSRSAMGAAPGCGRGSVRSYGWPRRQLRSAAASRWTQPVAVVGAVCRYALLQHRWPQAPPQVQGPLVLAPEGARSQWTQQRMHSAHRERWLWQLGDAPATAAVAASEGRLAVGRARAARAVGL